MENIGTSFSTIIDKFIFKIEKDRRFFNYYKLTDSESLEFVQQRALNYMEEAISLFKFKSDIPFDLLVKHSTEQCFVSNLTDNEVYLLTNLMYEIHLKRDLALLKVMTERYAPSDLTVFSPANERKSFLELISKIEQENERLLDAYDFKDRLTGKYKFVN